jgi:hypothetical protein
MKLKSLFFTFYLVLSQSAVAADGDDALFGLRWGMTVEQVRSTGVQLTKTSGDKNLETFKSSSVPKPLSGFASYSMIFADGKLVKLWAISDQISGDPTGSTGKERFETLNTLLVQKYGTPKQNMQSVGNRLFKEYDEFYQCLAYSGCGMWVSLFETTDKFLSLQVKGVRRGAGFLDITAEAKPQWSQALEVYKSRKNNSDKDAL